VKLTETEEFNPVVLRRRSMVWLPLVMFRLKEVASFGARSPPGQESRASAMGTVSTDCQSRKEGKICCVDVIQNVRICKFLDDNDISSFLWSSRLPGRASSQTK
jgi:hypothetical protein